jgi:hypothetical protein
MRSVQLYYRLLSGLIFILASCGDPYEETTRNISVPSFTTVEIKSVFSIYLVEDTRYGIVITGDKDAVNQVEARVEGEVLILSDHNKGKWLKPEQNKVKVYIHSPEHSVIHAKSSYSLHSVNTITSGALYILNYPDVKVSEIDLTTDCEFLWYWNNYQAGGNLIFKGKCDVLVINNYALHTVNTVELNARSGYINNFAKGDCKVYVAERLECQLQGMGNIYLYGDPAEIVLIERTSTGQLIKMN